MGFLKLRKLSVKWNNEEITIEHLIGQILQWAIKSDELLAVLNVRSKNTNNRLDAIEKKLNIK